MWETLNIFSYSKGTCYSTLVVEKVPALGSTSQV